MIFFSANPEENNNAMNVAFFLTHHKECNLSTLLDNIKNAMKVTFFLTP